jgi:integrase
LKTGVPARVPWVRIPPLPPVVCSPSFAIVRNPQQSQRLGSVHWTSLFSTVLPDQSANRGFDRHIDDNWSKWSKKHRAQWPSSLKAYDTDDRPSSDAEIKPSHIFELLQPIWTAKREAPNRVRGRIETITAKNVDIDDKDFAMLPNSPSSCARNFHSDPNGPYVTTLPCPYADASPFMVELSGAAGTAAAMLRFVIFTTCRTNGAIEARWSEIDRAASAWRIPGERMKMSEDRVVPLSDPALAILDKMPDGSQGELIFPESRWRTVFGKRRARRSRSHGLSHRGEHPSAPLRICLKYTPPTALGLERDCSNSLSPTWRNA